MMEAKGADSMERLSYGALERGGYDGYELREEPVRALQFGTGNFLRAFADYWLDVANERGAWGGKVALIQSTASGAKAALNRQQGLYTVVLRGSRGGVPVSSRRVVSCVDAAYAFADARDRAALLEIARSPELELILSNTTEAGIAYDEGARLDGVPVGFPAKLTQLLYARWRAGRGGVIVLACELIDENGATLKRYVLRHARAWGLEPEFLRWLEAENAFPNTLVDRIVPGGVRDPAERAALEAELGYADELLDVGEDFGCWIIEGDDALAARLPFVRAGIPEVRVVPDVAPYKQRKVRILNGAHTGFVPGAVLAGQRIVRDSLNVRPIRAFLERMLADEVIPTIAMPRAELEAFVGAVMDRFANPFIDHQLMSIALNSTAKWRTRNLPSLLDAFRARGELPRCLTMSLSFLLAFYTCEPRALDEAGLHCVRPDGAPYVISDDRRALELFWAHRFDSPDALTRAALADAALWGRDLNGVPGLTEAAARGVALIRGEGALRAFEVAAREDKR